VSDRGKVLLLPGCGSSPLVLGVGPRWRKEAELLVGRVATRRKVRVLKWFFKRFVVLRRIITYWRTFFFIRDTFQGSLKNSLRKWFLKEPWFEKLFVEAEMVP